MSTTVVDPTYAAESNLPRILGVLTTFFFVAVVVVGMRLYTRLRLTRAAGIDDALIFLAVLCQLGAWIVIVIQSRHGLGRHGSVISTADMTVFNHASFVGNVLGIAIGTMFLKTSIAFNLLRICKNLWFKIALWVVIAVVVVYELIGFLFFFLNCNPVSGNWDTTITAKCKTTKVIVAFGLFNTSCNIITDVSLAVLPIPIIWGLHMKKTVRLYLIGILSLGYLAVAMDVVKTYYQETYTATTDETYTFDLIFYGFMEDCIGLIAASTPMLRPLVGRAIGISTSDNYYYQYNANGSGRPSHVQGSGHLGSNVRRSVMRSGAGGGAGGGSGTGGSGMRSGMRSATRSGTDHTAEAYEMETDSEGGGGSTSGSGPHYKKNHTTSGVHAVSMYQHDGESEEIILQNAQYQAHARAEGGPRSPDQDDYKGITKTTEVVVR